jgi:NitT/TauT family transport system permease protein
MAGELLVIIAGTSSIGVLLNNDQQQLDMASVMAIMIVILVIGILVDALFGAADRGIRRRRGLEDNAGGSARQMPSGWLSTLRSGRAGAGKG